MQCTHPIEKLGDSGAAFAIRCGRCMPCRIDKRRKWTLRLLLEQMTSPETTFITLTYNDQNLPNKENYPNGELSKRDLQLFLKRLRSTYFRETGKRIRHFAVGEYGDQSGRAHYHAILYGLGIDDAEYIKRAWTHDNKEIGFIHVGEATPESMQYVANYTTKKVTQSYSDDKYEGRMAEFMLTSKKPGIGNDACELIAETLMSGDKRTFLYEGVLRIRGKKYPCDRFIKKRISHYMREQGSECDLQTQSPPVISRDERTTNFKNAEIKSKRIKNRGTKKEKI